MSGRHRSGVRNWQVGIMSYRTGCARIPQSPSQETLREQKPRVKLFLFLVGEVVVAIHELALDLLHENVVGGFAEGGCGNYAGFFEAGFEVLGRAGDDKTAVFFFENAE